MKKHLFTLLLAVVASMGMLTASNIEVNGIWYDLDATNLTATVTYRGNSFLSYTNEYSENVVIPSSFNYENSTYSVTSIGDYAFAACGKLTSVTIPNSVTSIGDYAFDECGKLTSITIPNSVTSIGEYAVADCSELTSITIPNSVTTIEDYAFFGCSRLTSITIPNGVTSIGSCAFYKCSSLTSVTIPNSVTSIGDGAFYRCSSLTSVTIGNSVTSIGYNAFYGCRLTDIVLPSSLQTIDEEAFAKNAICDEYDCLPSIKTITCYSQFPPSVHRSSGEYDSFKKSLTDDVIIYVPADYLNTYKAHDFWGLYDVRPLNKSATGIEDTFSNEGSQSSQPQKVLIDGKMYIALPNGHLYDATGRQVE